MTDQVTPPEGGALPSKGANPSFAAAKAEAQAAEAKAKEAEAVSPPAATDPSDKPKPPKSGEQVRIDELTRRLREAERREQRLMRLYEEGIAKPPEKPQQPEAVKTLKDFAYDDAAYVRYLEERGKANTQSTVKAELEKAKNEEAEKEALKSYGKRASEYAKTVDNYDEIAGSSPISDDIAKLIMRMQDGPEVAYYLGNNHDTASAISELPLQLAALELGRIASRMEFERKKATEKPVSQAPPPPPKVEGGDPGNIEKDPSKMTDAQFRKWREKTIASRR